MFTISGVFFLVFFYKIDTSTVSTEICWIFFRPVGRFKKQLYARKTKARIAVASISFLGHPLFKNLTIFNLIRWVARLIDQASDAPSVNLLD